METFVKNIDPCLITNLLWNILLIYIILLLILCIISLMIFHYIWIDKKYKYKLLADYMSELTETNILKREALIENFAINIKLREAPVSSLTLKNELKEYLEKLKKTYPDDKDKIVEELSEIVKNV